MSNDTRTAQYARLVNRWVAMVGLDPADYGTHSLRRTDEEIPIPPPPRGRGGTVG